MMIDREIVKFCAIECRLQISGEISVSNMVDAWIYAQEIAKDNGDGNGYILPTTADVQNIGKLVEPNVNLGPGFRKVNVRVGSNVKMDWQLVPQAMVGLMEVLNDETPCWKGNALTPAEFFKEYEDVHPWQDGNGRSGAVLFNWINGTLDDPIWPPNFWNDPRRTIGYGA